MWRGTTTPQTTITTPTTTTTTGTITTTATPDSMRRALVCSPYYGSGFSFSIGFGFGAPFYPYYYAPFYPAYYGYSPVLRLLPSVLRATFRTHYRVISPYYGYNPYYYRGTYGYMPGGPNYGGRPPYRFKPGLPASPGGPGTPVGYRPRFTATGRDPRGGVPTIGIAPRDRSNS